MDITRRTVTEIHFRSGEGPLVDTMDGLHRVDVIGYEHATFDDNEVLDTVTVKGRKVKKDGSYHDRVQYPMPVWGDAVDALTAEWKDAI